MQLYKLMIN